MPSYRTGRVVSVLAERDGLQRVLVGPGPDDDGWAPAGERAYVLTALTGTVAVGDDVVCNTTAVELGLGTGGWHVVHWNLSRRTWASAGPGHILKLRYTSLQADTGAAEEHLEHLPTTLDGMVVVACTLHSQVGVVAAVLRHLRPDVRIAYVMTDGAALPLAMSDLVHDLRRVGVLDASVTAGHAFGGDVEAVAVPSALALARHVVGAGVAVVGMGPGVVGTGTTLGTTAVEAAAVVDTASALGGRPVLCARVSDGDGRDRHRGLSHHTRTVLDLIRTPEVPAPLPGDLEGVPDVAAVLELLGLRITTMGRGPAADPAFFAACGAAAAEAASLLGPPAAAPRPPDDVT